MKTTFTKSFEKSFLHGLAGVSKRKSRKQVLLDIVSEAETGIDMAKGLQGRGDWHGAATKMVSAAGLLDQAIDLAETLPGVNFERTRQQAKLVIDRLGKEMPLLTTDPLVARGNVRCCEDALAKAVEAIRLFSDRLRDDVLCKDGEELEFDEDEIIKEVDKVMLGVASKDPGAARRQRIGQQSGVFQTGESGSSWEAVPGKGGRQRRKKADGSYEYRDAAAVSASVEGEDVKKAEEPEPKETEEESEETPEMEKPPVEEEKDDVLEEAAPEEKTLDLSVLTQQTRIVGELGKTKKGKK